MCCTKDIQLCLTPHLFFYETNQQDKNNYVVKLGQHSYFLFQQQFVYCFFGLQVCASLLICHNVKKKLEVALSVPHQLFLKQLQTDEAK